MEETNTLDKVVILIEQVHVTNVNQTFNNDCSICLEGFHEHNNSDVVNIACGHKFHFECIRDFVISQLQSDSNITCPICRLSIMENKHELYVGARASVVQMQNANAERTDEPLTLQEQTWVICIILGRMLVLLLIFAICVILVGLLLLFVL